MFGYHYTHEVVVTKKNTIVLIDVAYVEYNGGFEGAYAIFDEDIFKDWWKENSEEEEYDLQDIKDWGEESGAFDCWDIVIENCKTGRSAEIATRIAIRDI